MSGQLKVTNVLKNHELRLRTVEQKKKECETSAQHTLGNPSLVEKRVQLVQSITTQINTRLNKTTNDVTSLQELVNKQNERLTNLYDLLVLNQKEFLAFKQGIEEKNKVELIVTEKELATIVEESDDEDSCEEDSAEEDIGEEESADEEESAAEEEEYSTVMQALAESKSEVINEPAEATQPVEHELVETSDETPCVDEESLYDESFDYSHTTLVTN